MPESIILVNGLPGAGKTTLATALSKALTIPLLTKDALKESLAEAAPGLPPSAYGPAASETMWLLAAATPTPVILENWWFKPRDRPYAEQGLHRCGNPPTLEIWCEIPPATAFARYQSRNRPALYADAHHAQESWPTWAAAAEPLSLTPVLRVPTTTPQDIPALAARVTKALAPDPSPAPSRSQTCRGRA